MPGILDGIKSAAKSMGMKTMEERTAEMKRKAEEDRKKKEEEEASQTE